MAVGGALIAVAAALSWARHAAPFGGGTISVTGLDLAWGRFTLGLGLLTVVAGSVSAIFASPALRRGLAVVGIAAGLTAGGIALYHASGTTPDLRPAFQQAVLRDHAALQAGARPQAGGGGVRPGQNGGGPAPGSQAGGSQAPQGPQGPTQQRPGVGRGFASSLPSTGLGIWLAVAGGLIVLIGGIASFGSTASAPATATGFSPGGAPGPDVPPTPTEPTDRLQPIGVGAQPTERIDVPGPAQAGGDQPTERIDVTIPPRPEEHDEEGSAA
jgi:hypothetical protein